MIGHLYARHPQVSGMLRYRLTDERALPDYFFAEVEDPAFEVGRFLSLGWCIVMHAKRSPVGQYSFFDPAALKCDFSNLEDLARIIAFDETGRFSERAYHHLITRRWEEEQLPGAQLRAPEDAIYFMGVHKKVEQKTKKMMREILEDSSIRVLSVEERESLIESLYGEEERLTWAFSNIVGGFGSVSQKEKGLCALRTLARDSQLRSDKIYAFYYLLLSQGHIAEDIESHPLETVEAIYERLLEYAPQTLADIPMRFADDPTGLQNPLFLFAHQFYLTEKAKQEGRFVVLGPGARDYLRELKGSLLGEEIQREILEALLRGDERFFDPFFEEEETEESFFFEEEETYLGQERAVIESTASSSEPTPPSVVGEVEELPVPHKKMPWREKQKKRGHLDVPLEEFMGRGCNSFC